MQFYFTTTGFRKMGNRDNYYKHVAPTGLISSQTDNVKTA
jgi:hypothetical protein